MTNRVDGFDPAVIMQDDAGEDETDSQQGISGQFKGRTVTQLAARSLVADASKNARGMNVSEEGQTNIVDRTLKMQGSGAKALAGATQLATGAGDAAIDTELYEEVEAKEDKDGEENEGGIGKIEELKKAKYFAQKTRDRQNIEKLMRFLSHLKSLGKLSPEELQDLAAEYFPDVTHQHLALAFAKEVFEEEPEHMEKVGVLDEAIQEHMEENAPGIRAGLNVSSRAVDYSELDS